MYFLDRSCTVIYSDLSTKSIDNCDSFFSIFQFYDFLFIFCLRLFCYSQKKTVMMKNQLKFISQNLIIDIDFI